LPIASSCPYGVNGLPIDFRISQNRNQGSAGTQSGSAGGASGVGFVVALFLVLGSWFWLAFVSVPDNEPDWLPDWFSSFGPFGRSAMPAVLARLFRLVAIDRDLVVGPAVVPAIAESTKNLPSTYSTALRCSLFAAPAAR
jgi:hypothetical protein